MTKIFTRNTLLIVCGFIIILFILWNRLLRVRFPKMLPITLINYDFVFLTVLCLLLFYSLILLILNYFFKFQLDSKSIVTKINSFYIESLQQVDFKLKSFDFIWKNIKIYHNTLLISFRDYAILISIFIIFRLIKLIPIILLSIDTFYFQEIYYFYISLPLFFIPLLFQYIYHSLHYYYVKTLEDIEKVLDIYVYAHPQDNNVVEYKNNIEVLHYFIQETTQERLGNREVILEFKITLTKNFILKNPKADLDDVFNFFYIKMLSICSDYYEVLYKITVIRNRYDFWINIIFLVISLICWTYMLLSSNYSFTEDFLTFWLTIQTNI
jgi:hypothetical protein